MNIPVNALGKPFTWSFSALNQFETCPAQYAAERFFCTSKSEPTIHTEWGTYVHKALEERCRDGKPLPDSLETYEKWARVIDRSDGNKFFERQVAFDQRLTLLSFFDKKVWGRGVIDVMIYSGKKVSLIDWKTGKVKDDPTQLKLFACFASLLCPEAEEFNCKFVWLKHDQITGETLRKDELGPFWSDVVRRVYRMQEAWETGGFNANPSGLCRGWCSNGEGIHWKPKRK